MGFKVIGRFLEEIVVLEPDIYEDERGVFQETFRADRFREIGLHFQWDPPMGKLMRVTAGAAYLVAVDLRRDSATLGRWYGLEVSAASGRMVWAPPSFARGFCALEDGTEVLYKCTGIYNPACEAGIRWDDPAIGVTWPVGAPILSAKDAAAAPLAAWLARPESTRFTRARPPAAP